jgi:two-component system, NarL family, sensor histidine kinase DesK
MTRASVPAMDPRGRWQRLGWALPWLLFLAFPVVDLVVTDRPVAVRVAAAAGLVVFTVAYVRVFTRLFSRAADWPRREMLVLAVLGVTLAVGLGPAWTGLMIYVSVASAGVLPQRWVWPAVLGSAAVAVAVVAADGLLGDLFILPLMCVLSAFALLGTRTLVAVNAELAEAREELAHRAVAEERMRFARDLHDLLGHSLSLIALKSELAGRLAERDPGRARQEMADVESAARQALAEVRDAVSGYRQVSLAQALVEARSALSAAGIALRPPTAVDVLPGPVDAVLGWVVREAVTNVLRHSGATTVTIDLDTTADDVLLGIADDGRGSAAPPGAGLSGLAERVQRLGGDLRTTGESGFRLTARLPLTAPAEVDRMAGR